MNETKNLPQDSLRSRNSVPLHSSENSFKRYMSVWAHSFSFPLAEIHMKMFIFLSYMLDLCACKNENSAYVFEQYIHNILKIAKTLSNSGDVLTSTPRSFIDRCQYTMSDVIWINTSLTSTSSRVWIDLVVDLFINLDVQTDIYSITGYFLTNFWPKHWTFIFVYVRVTLECA